jgi:hypothetical protein
MIQEFPIMTAIQAYRQGIYGKIPAVKVQFNAAPLH